MLKYLNSYISDFERDLNIELMRKEADEPLIEYVKDAWRSLQVVKNIEIIDFKYTDRESVLDINDHMLKREKKKKKKDRHPYKFINDDRFGCLSVHVRVKILEEDRKTGNKVLKVKDIKKDMLVPIQDDQGYYFIKGKKYYLMYQLVDKSTYTSPSSVTLKSLTPIAAKRTSIKRKTVTQFEVTPKRKPKLKMDNDNIPDTLDNDDINDNITTHRTYVIDNNGTEFNLPVYNVFVFRKEIPVLLFYLANDLTWALHYLGIADVIHLIDNLSEMNEDENLYFQISTKCYIEVNKEMFIKYQYVQSMVGTLLEITSNRVTLDDLNDPHYWMKKLSSNNTIEKGEDILVFFNRLMDETTKKILKVDDYQKYNIYAVLRWMMQNYNELRLKDNLNLNNKRLRCNEYVAGLITLEFSKRLYRLITLGSKATMQDFVDTFKFGNNILLQKMHSSGLLIYDDTVNDMDFFSKYKFTTKGPNSLGNKNSNNISIKYRGIHPSYLGNIDILVCGNSDPGTSGLLSPFSKIKGLYFDNKNEPDSFGYDFNKDIRRILESKNYECVSIRADNPEDYNQILNNIWKINNQIKITTTSLNDLDIIIENDDVNLNNRDNFKS